MCWKICSCSCCRGPKNLEKVDANPIYGDYYYPDGERMTDEMEVAFKIIANTQSKKMLTEHI